MSGDLGRLLMEEPVRLDLHALAVAAAFRDVDEEGVVAELDRLGNIVVARGVPDDPMGQAHLLASVLGDEVGFVGNSAEYDHPDNSMIDLVLERRTGLPILLSVIWVEVGRRVGIPVHGVGLPGHYIAAVFGEGVPVAIDPFRGGTYVEGLHGDLVPTSGTATVLRMLSNLVVAYERRGDLAHTLRAARLRLDLPLDARDRRVMEFEERRLGARLN